MIANNIQPIPGVTLLPTQTMYNRWKKFLKITIYPLQVWSPQEMGPI